MKIHMTVLLEFLLVILVAQSGANYSFWDKIEPLTDTNFTRKLTQEKDKVWLVIFYAPWDEHVKSFAPKLEMALADLTSKGYQVRFGSVDVSLEKKLGWKYQIDRSPLVKLFNPDEVDQKTGQWKVTDYQGQREPMAVCEFCINNHRQRHLPYTRLPVGYSDGDIIDLNDNNFDEVVIGSNQVWFIEFVAPWCYHCKLMKPALTAASRDLDGKVRFASVNADKNRDLARRFNIKALPTIIYFKGGYVKTDDSAVMYQGGRSSGDFTWKALELLHQFTEDSNKPAWISPKELAKAQKKQCALQDSPDADNTCQSSLPSEINSACSNGSLCIVAFLQESYAHDRQTLDLGEVAGTWYRKNVQVFWIERGSNSDCEKALHFPVVDAPVIAFREDWGTYEKMQYSLNIENLNKFIDQVYHADGTNGSTQPYGGIKLLK